MISQETFACQLDGPVMENHQAYFVGFWIEDGKWQRGIFKWAFDDVEALNEKWTIGTPDFSNVSSLSDLRQNLSPHLPTLVKK